MWSDLPAYARADLRSIQLAPEIFDQQLDEIQRLSILNIYAKLRNLLLDGKPFWDFLDSFHGAHRGVMDFSVTDVGAFKDALRRTRNYSNPSASNEAWDSRELCLRYSLHFRHNQKYQSHQNDVSAHIDPIGLYTGPGLWRKPQALLTGPLHLLCYHSYKRVEEIQRQLLQRENA